MEKEDPSTRNRTEPCQRRLALPEPTTERTFPSSPASFSPTYAEDLVGSVLKDHFWTLNKSLPSTGPIPTLDLGSFYNQFHVNAVFCDDALKIDLC